MKNKLYLCYFCYFATGEGYREYWYLLKAKDKTAAKDKFWKKKLSIKWGQNSEDARKFCERGIEIFETKTLSKELILEKISSYWMKQINIDMIEDLFQKGGLIEGDIDLFFQYNLS